MADDNVSAIAVAFATICTLIEDCLQPWALAHGGMSRLDERPLQSSTPDKSDVPALRWSVRVFITRIIRSWHEQAVARQVTPRLEPVQVTHLCLDGVCQDPTNPWQSSPDLRIGVLYDLTPKFMSCRCNLLSHLAKQFQVTLQRPPRADTQGHIIFGDQGLKKLTSCLAE